MNDGDYVTDQSENCFHEWLLVNDHDPDGNPVRYVHCYQCDSLIEIPLSWAWAESV